MTLNVLDLFSGIGGFSYGLEKLKEFQTVAFCEKDKQCQRVLQKHWPGVPIFEDVKNLTAADILPTISDRVDVICGGFPCQDISLAGKGEGLSGARSGLWFEYYRLIRELKPSWVIIENVSALRNRGLSTIIYQLSQVGYVGEWHCITARAFGAPHERDRIWIVAHPHREGQERFRFTRPLSFLSAESHSEFDNNFATSWRALAGSFLDIRIRDGISLAMERSRISQLGNSVVPIIPYYIGQQIVTYVNANKELTNG